MKNIVLIGMPASGKSTVGKILTENLGYEFIDVDRLIEAREGKTLSEIIAEKGADGFNDIENSVNLSIEADRAVIATGGSAVYGESGMEHLKRIGCVFYLKVSFEELKNRLADEDFKARGVSVKEGVTLFQLYKERTPLYERYADFTVEESKITPEECAEKITECINFDRE